MSSPFETYKPDGFHTLNVYLVVDDAVALIAFLKEAFDADELNRSLAPDGRIANVILRIGDSCLMIGEARPPYTGMKTSMYIFVDNVDDMHARAIAAGGIEEFPPGDKPYGDRQSGIIDPCGNYWWLSKRIDETPYHS